MDRMKLLVSIVERGHGVAMQRLYGKYQLFLHLQCAGRGTATSEIMDILGLGSTEKDVVLTFASQAPAAALLHDIGRHLQYTQNIPHDQASAQLAEVILADCGFSKAERAEVEDAILQHRGRQDRQREGLAGLLYGADKASRACLFCPAEPECNWSPEKKNMRIKA